MLLEEGRGAVVGQLGVAGIVMLAAVSISRRTLGSTDWVLKRLPVIKWVTAAVMAILIVYTWVV